MEKEDKQIIKTLSDEKWDIWDSVKDAGLYSIQSLRGGRYVMIVGYIQSTNQITTTKQ